MYALESNNVGNSKQLFIGRLSSQCYRILEEPSSPVTIIIEPVPLPMETARTWVEDKIHYD